MDQLWPVYLQYDVYLSILMCTWITSVVVFQLRKNKQSYSYITGKSSIQLPHFKNHVSDEMK